MKIAMAQMRMAHSVQENLHKTLGHIARAKAAGADLIFWPEVQLSPFFPQQEHGDAQPWLMTENDPAIAALREACGTHRIWASPNVYLLQNGKRYDASLFINSEGHIVGISKMVHIAQAAQFYEQSYYTPSEEGFRVYSTPFGNVGVVICFDRHLPDGIRSCAQQGAELVLIPTANVKTEPLELFEWEARVQAFQNTVFVAMCNRVGQEDAMAFAGESLIAGPDGSRYAKLDDSEQLFVAEVPLEQVWAARRQRPWLTL